MELLAILLGMIVLILISYMIGNIVGSLKKHREWEKIILPKRLKSSRSVIGGQVSEQIAPFLPDFPYKASECRFIGKPLDFIVFEGMDEKQIKNVIFVEVKSGSSQLTPQEKHLKDAILHKNVQWCEWRIKN